MSSRSTAAALGSWADVVSVTCGVHIVTHCIKSTLLTMRLSEAVSVDEYMAAADVFFVLMNSLANVTVVLRPACHLPVMLVYDRRLRTAALRLWRAVRTTFVTTVLPYVLGGESEWESDSVIDSIELDSIMAEDDALDEHDDLDKAVPV